MKEKIKALFKEYYNDETMPVVELEDKVLALFDVVGQNEQLVCSRCNENEKQESNDPYCIDCKIEIEAN